MLANRPLPSCRNAVNAGARVGPGRPAPPIVLQRCKCRRSFGRDWERAAVGAWQDAVVKRQASAILRRVLREVAILRRVWAHAAAHPSTSAPVLGATAERPWLTMGRARCSARPSPSCRQRTAPASPVVPRECRPSPSVACTGGKGRAACAPLCARHRAAWDKRAARDGWLQVGGGLSRCVRLGRRAGS